VLSVVFTQCSCASSFKVQAQELEVVAGLLRSIRNSKKTCVNTASCRKDRGLRRRCLVKKIGFSGEHQKMQLT